MARKKNFSLFIPLMITIGVSLFLTFVAPYSMYLFEPIACPDDCSLSVKETVNYMSAQKGGFKVETTCLCPSGTTRDISGWMYVIASLVFAGVLFFPIFFIYRSIVKPGF
jgi:hypothetical protein